MQFVWNENGNELEVLAKAATANASSVIAAIAYATDDRSLLEICWRLNKPLKLYARYDFTGPVSDVVSQWFLSKRSQCADYDLLLVPDFFHPKVIWWRSVGAYIGSANLTKTAWSRNIEAGVFLSEEELNENGILDELEDFFDDIHAKATSITREVADEMTAARARNGEAQGTLERQFESTRKLPPVPSKISITKIASREKKKRKFIEEWRRTLGYLLDIGERLKRRENVPPWLPSTPSQGVLADQFLHALYYYRVKDGQYFPYDEWHERNRERKEPALAKEIQWWSEQTSPPGREDVHILEWAPFVRSKLSRDSILTLTENDFVEVCKRIHAVTDHARRLNHETFGLQHNLVAMTAEGRIEFFARWLYKARSEGGRSVLELFNHVLYGGSRDDAPNRLFVACHDPAWKISHVGVSTLGEMIGWAMPDDFPPRNGRTSKALRALGYDVTIHSE